MNDDLGTPAAVAVLHNTVREGNLALDTGDQDSAAERLGEVIGVLAILGLDAGSQAWEQPGADQRLAAAVDGLIAELLKQREAARERKDFASADAIRDSLAEVGIEVSDTPQGPRWKLR
jgi:cysteinyl-tRNA synthetase